MYLRTPRRDDGYGSYGYEIYLPNVIVRYLSEIELQRAISHTYNSQRATELRRPFMRPGGAMPARHITPGVSNGLVSSHPRRRER